MKVGSSADTFKIGFNPYLPVIIDCPNCNGSETFTVSVSDGFYKNPITETDLQTDNVVTHTWKIETDADKKVNLTVQWNGSDEGSNLGSNLYLGFWRDGSSTAWKDSAGTTMTKSGTDPYSLTRTIRNMTGTYYIAVGNDNSPLPVELTSFEVTWSEIAQAAQLDWETASEVNNDYFEVQRRSPRSDEWETIGTVKGAGTSIVSNTYTFTDQDFDLSEPGSHTYYYRLQQHDFDGQSEYSSIRSITVEVQEPDAISAYPNPVTSDYVYTTHVGHFYLYDSRGNLIREFADTRQLYVGDLSKGIYLLTYHQKVVTKLIKD